MAKYRVEKKDIADYYENGCFEVSTRPHYMWYVQEHLGQSLLDKEAWRTIKVFDNPVSAEEFMKSLTK